MVHSYTVKLQENCKAPG